MMPEVNAAIRKWLHQQQDWLQEAAERLLALASGSLQAADIQSIVESLKSPAGREVTTHRTFDGLGTASSLAGELRLVEIGDISGIENLAPRRPLALGTGNLTVIYGLNGSGKSGYTRILKRACGKPRAAALKSNVFQNPPATRKCRIAFRLAGTDRSVEWLATGPALDELRAVDIFDADVAAFYISQETAASYTPAAVSLFEALARVCDQAKARLQEEQDRLVSELPTVPPEYAGTMVGRAYAALKPDISEDAIQGLTHWGEDNQHTLEQLAERLRSDDPKALARRKRSTRHQLEQLTEHLKRDAAAVGPHQIEALWKAREEAERKRRVAAEAAQLRLHNAKLDGIGTETWNALWQAARSYSQLAYPGQEYPVTGDGKRCVLCHQELAHEAQQRLRDFEAFVQGTVEAEARRAEGAYKTAVAGLPVIPNDEAIRTRCEAAGLSEEGWPERLRGFWARVGKTCARLMSGETAGHAAAVEPPDDVLDEMAQRLKALERDAARYDEDAERFDRDRATGEKLNLEARRWTAQQAAAIRREIARLRDVEKYEDWKKLTNSQHISLKEREIAERVITQAYVDRFNRELEALGASRIKVELTRTRTEKGRTLHKLRLKGVQADQAPPESILSEGERRVVALAAFLADVAEKPHVAPFIFDDPISSLDHDFEWHVASRLAQLAQRRQVIVLTHRLSLYGALVDAAAKVGDGSRNQHLEQRCIEAFAGVAGHPTEEAVWSENTTKANNILLTRLDEARRAGEASGAAAYRLRAQGICTDFRKLLERTVEDDLLNKVVRRHRRSVTTDERLARLASITPEDCRFIDALMTKYSRYEHSQSDEIPTVLPEESELGADLEGLKAWREGFKKRRTDSVP